MKGGAFALGGRWGLRLLAAAVFAGAIGCGPGSAPDGQHPLVTLTDATLGTFRQQHDETRDATRVVLLLSPT